MGRFRYKHGLFPFYSPFLLFIYISFLNSFNRLRFKYDLTVIYVIFKFSKGKLKFL